MSKYTTEVRYICETAAGLKESEGYNSVEDILDKSWENIFSFPFPLFDNDYRSVLCKKILKHYYTREIGLETVGLWKLKLDTKMNEIMPYYNKLYESELLKWNPLTDADYTKTHEGKNAGKGTDSGTHGGTIGDVRNEKADEKLWDVYSDTPQGGLTNVDNETYLTNARKTTRDSEINDTNTRTFNETTGTSRSYNNTDEYIEHVIGKFPGKSYSSLIKEFRETFLNIDVAIIEDLSDLFIKLW